MISIFERQCPASGAGRLADQEAAMKRAGYAAAGLSLAVLASLAAAGCSGSNGTSSSAAPPCFGKHAVTGTTTPAGTGSAPAPAKSAAAAAWTLPGGNLQNTRDVSSA